jgi:NAD(P)-dependent dehydrogenase (short-subunit alcohol dehydrogenase family)
MRVYIASRKAEADERSIPADLSTEEGCRGLAAAVAEREEAVHLLVNNSGATWGAPLEEYTDSAFDKLWAINVKGVFHLTRALLPQLRAAASAEDPARVVNIGSVDGIRVPVMETYAYSTTKAAVHMLTRHLARNLAREHITVNAVAPGPFDSKMMAFALDDPSTRSAIASSVPLGRVGEPDDVAGTVIFLASRAGAYLTGAVIPVDGGITA